LTGGVGFCATLCTDSDGERKPSGRSSTLDDSGNVRTLRAGQEAIQDTRDAGDVTVNAGPAVPHHVSQSPQPGVHYRGWPHLDVTMATRIQQRSSTIELGMIEMIQRCSFTVTDAKTLKKNLKRLRNVDVWKNTKRLKT